MKTLIVILAICLASCASKIPITKLEQEAMRLKEERKFGRRHITKPTISVIHITLFVSASLILWYESVEDHP